MHGEKTLFFLSVLSASVVILFFKCKLIGEGCQPSDRFEVTVHSPPTYLATSIQHRVQGRGLNE